MHQFFCSYRPACHGLGTGWQRHGGERPAPYRHVGAKLCRLGRGQRHYEIQSSKLALSKARNPATKNFAREMIADHTQTTRSLMAELPKSEPRVAKPGKALTEPNAAKIAALRAAPADGFDALYMQQQAEAHRAAYALHKGYATDGQDPALRQVATSAVPIIEKHLAHVQAAPGAM